MNNYINKKQKNKKIKSKIFIFCKLLITSLLISMQASQVIATKGLENYIANFESLSITDETTSINNYNLNQNLIKNQIALSVKNRLNRIKYLYNTAIANDTSLPTEVNASLQIALLDTNTILNNNIPFIRLDELEQKLANLIKQQDGSMACVITSLGFHQITNSIESNNAIEIFDKLSELFKNYITFELEYYDSELASVEKISVKSVAFNNKEFPQITEKLQDILEKHQKMPIEEQQNHKLKLNYETLVANDRYFNHKKTTIPHGIALYARIKNNKLDILVFEPLAGSSITYSGISLIDTIHNKIKQQVINNQDSSKIKFDIYEIPLAVELCGTDCMTHSYEICKEINNNVSTLNNIIDAMDSCSSKVDAYNHILNNIPVTFFKTIYQLDFLENIIEINNPKRANEVSQLKNYLEQYFYNNNFAVFSTSIFEMGLYEIDKDKLVNKVKFYYPESDNTHNYLGYFKNVNTLILNSQLQLAQYTIDCLSDDNTINNLTLESLLELDNATADIETISNDSLDKSLAFVVNAKTQYQEYANEYYAYKVKFFIDSLIKLYDSEKRSVRHMKNKTNEVQIFVETTKDEFKNRGSMSFDFKNHKQQILAADLRQLLTNSLQILNKEINSTAMCISEEDKIQIATEMQHAKNIIQALCDEIKLYFKNNNIDIEKTNFYLKDNYFGNFNIYFFKILVSKIENIINILNINNNDFFQEILKEQTINLHKDLIGFFEFHVGNHLFTLVKFSLLVSK